MEKKETMRVNIDPISYQKDVAMKMGDLKPLQEGINKLRTKKMQVPWDELYNALEKGCIQDVMAKIWAENNVMEWDEVETRNFARARFNFLPRENFDKIFIRRQPDGSFDVSASAVRDLYSSFYVREIKAEDVEAINTICELLTKLKIAANVVSRILGTTQAGKVIPFWSKVAGIIGERIK